MSWQLAPPGPKTPITSPCGPSGEDCYGSLDGVARSEGGSVGVVSTTSLAECQSACTGNLAALGRSITNEKKNNVKRLKYWNGHGLDAKYVQILFWVCLHNVNKFTFQRTLDELIGSETHIGKQLTTVRGRASCKSFALCTLVQVIGRLTWCRSCGELGWQ